MVLFTYWTGAIRKGSDLTTLFEGSFGEHSYRVVEVISEQIRETTETFSDGYVPKVTATRMDPTPHAVYVLLVQIFTSLLAYWSAKFAAKVCIQSVGFSLPLTCVTPFSIVIVMTMCGAKAYDKVWCFLQNIKCKKNFCFSVLLRKMHFTFPTGFSLSVMLHPHWLTLVGTHWST